MPPTRACPKCHKPLRAANIAPAGSFECPHCRTRLQAPNSFGVSVAVASLISSVALSLGIGLRGVRLFSAAAILLVIIDFVAINVVKYVIPPKIQLASPSKSFRELVGRVELNLRDAVPPKQPRRSLDSESSLVKKQKGGESG
jgi:RNA polymerase subunit RPABC4/transcription elongation factor Spt4